MRLFRHSILQNAESLASQLHFRFWSVAIASLCWHLRFVQPFQPFRWLHHPKATGAVSSYWSVLMSEALNLSSLLNGLAKAQSFDTPCRLSAGGFGWSTWIQSSGMSVSSLLPNPECIIQGSIGHLKLSEMLRRNATKSAEALPSWKVLPQLQGCLKQS